MVGRRRKRAENSSKGEIYRPGLAAKQAGWDPTLAVFGQNALCTLVTESKWQCGVDTDEAGGLFGPLGF